MRPITPGLPLILEDAELADMPGNLTETLTHAFSADGVKRFLAWLKSRLVWLANLNTERYPPEVRRRLKILNMMSYLIVVTTAIFGIQQAINDHVLYMPAILINIFLIGMALLVPWAHRINEIAGGVLLVATEWIALFCLTAFFSRDGGSHLHYFIGAAAAFVVFGLGRIRLVLAVVVSGLVLHLVAWFWFPPGNSMVQSDRTLLDPIYTQAAITTVGVIAAAVYYAFSLAEKAKAEADRLLRNILPESIVERLTEKPDQSIADSFEDASILFADISGFVPLARTLGAARTVELLNRMVSEFDVLAKQHKVEKIKTIGDAYMVASGLPERSSDHVERLARLSLDMLRVVERLNAETGHDLKMRIGIASGPVLAGVIGSHKFSYDVWGDAVNLAARLENASTPGRVLICPGCHKKLEGRFALESRGLVDIKGLGPRETWYLVAPDDDAGSDLDSIRGCISAAS